MVKFNINIQMHIERKKLLKLGLNSYGLPFQAHILYPGTRLSCTDSLMVSEYELEREDHKFNPRLGKLFLYQKEMKITN